MPVRQPGQQRHTPGGVVNIEGDIDHMGIIVGVAHQGQHIAMGSKQQGEVGTGGGAGDALRIVVVTIEARGDGGYRAAMGQQARQKPGVFKRKSFGEEAMVEEAAAEHLVPGVCMGIGTGVKPVTAPVGIDGIGQRKLVAARRAIVYLYGIFDEVVVGMGGEQGKQRGQRMGLEHIVAVDKGDVGRMAAGDAGVAGGTETAIGLVDDADAVATLCPPVAQVTTGVGRTIVDEDEFATVSLAEHALDTAVKGGSGLVDGDDDCEDKGCHGRMYVSCIYRRVSAVMRQRWSGRSPTSHTTRSRASVTTSWRRFSMRLRLRSVR